MSYCLKTSTAAQVADLLENGGVPIDKVAELMTRTVELLRELAAAPVAQEPMTFDGFFDRMEQLGVTHLQLPGYEAQPAPAQGEPHVAACARCGHLYYDYACPRPGCR